MAEAFHHRVALATHGVVAARRYRDRRLLLVLGTMRSGSTLLGSVLTSHPEIAGIGESHVDYVSSRSVADLAYWTARFSRRYPGRQQILFDKVLHERHVPEPEMLVRISRPTVIFLLREPVSNLLSASKMIERRQEDVPQTPLQRAERHLLRRYAQLERFAERLPDTVPCALVSYERLTAASDETLEGLSRFLDLRSPLSSQYEVPKWAGRWGIGDGGPVIRTGSIVARSTEAVEVPYDTSAITESYARLRAHLSDRVSVSIT